MSCFIIALIVAVSSIFAFFGSVFGFNSYSGNLSSMIPNMFNLAFGSIKSYTSTGYVVKWEQFQGFVFLFSWQIVIMAMFIIATIHIVYLKNNYDINDGNCTLTAYSIFLIAMSLTACITSFCCLNMLSDQFLSTRSYVHLGIGPIIYSVMHIVVVIFLICQLFNNYVNKPKITKVPVAIRRPEPTSQYERQTPIKSSNYSYSVNNQQSVYPKSDNQNSYQQKDDSINQPATKDKPELSETERVELLIKYKKLLDDGVITQKEFDAKKKDLL